jgi:hypothetical protein
MFNFYSKCKDKSKCIFIGLATLVITLLGAYGLSQLEGANDRMTMVDGIYYDNNPWTKSNN